ncbi:MAG TPA: pyridoxamine 5'-phosphate oxidase family protein [Acidimicrobiales bacterium]|nr:pyridoxamine 5'-phosphate oxidase family protein [Acidimicrobiales bacterium]
MGSIDRTTAMEFLSQAECWQLLASHAVGRLGVATRTGPEIYPVNYVLDDEAIVFRTDPGGKLASLAGNPAVCFEIDHVDAEARTGWSVLVKGTAQQLDPRQRDQAAALGLEYWAIGTKAHWVRIHPIEVTGRRIWQAAVPAARPADAVEVLDPLVVRPDR